MRRIPNVAPSVHKQAKDEAVRKIARPGPVIWFLVNVVGKAAPSLAMLIKGSSD